MVDVRLREVRLKGSESGCGGYVGEKRTIGESINDQLKLCDCAGPQASHHGLIIHVFETWSFNPGARYIRPYILKVQSSLLTA